MNFEKTKVRIKTLTHYLELVLALFIVMSVVIGMVDLVRYIVLILTTNAIDSYEIFQKFLGYVLLLVVGVELVVMLVFHSPSSVIEVLLYAVARKLLIGNQGMLDFIVGVVAIAAIFAIRKFLFVEDLSNPTGGNKHYFSAATSVKVINEMLDINIPEELGNTIGGVIYRLAQDSDIRLTEGVEFNLSRINFRVLRMQDGVIGKVAITVNKG